MIGFLRCVLRMKRPWPIWVLLLVGLNGVAPLFFLDTVEGRMVLTAFLAGAFLQVALYETRGFVRLLGLGHFLWVPLVAWIGGRLVETGVRDRFSLWLAAVLVADGLSLIVDAADVIRYLRGEREPVVVLEPAAAESVSEDE